MKFRTYLHLRSTVASINIAAAILVAGSIQGMASETNTITGANAGSSLTSGNWNTINGYQAMQQTTTGSANVAVGYKALKRNVSGTYNVAVGPRALQYNRVDSNTALGFAALNFNTTGKLNTATGRHALRFNTTGSSNVASGFQALARNTKGSFNVAIGDGALANNTTGTGNVAVGEDAGYNLTTGDNNICIDSKGVAGESGAIRIGTPGTHERTMLSGRVGIGEENPQSALDVSATADNAATIRGEGNAGPFTVAENHVMHVISTQGRFSSCLALQLGDAFPDRTDNLITFYNAAGGAMGRIQAINSSTSAFVTRGADFAEVLPLAESVQAQESAGIVPVHAGEIGDWAKADHFMVVSVEAGFVGNDPGENVEAGGRHHRIAFLGQVPVKVRGKVNAGDYIIASEKNDGTGVASPADDIGLARMHRVVGRAWEGSRDDGLKDVNTAVGLDQTSLVIPVLQRLELENRELRERLEKLENRLNDAANPEKVIVNH